MRLAATQALAAVDCGKPRRVFYKRKDESPLYWLRISHIKNKRIAIILLTLLLAAAAAGYFALRQADESAYESCLLSMEGAFSGALSSAELKDKIPVSDEWRILDEDEERLLFDKFIRIGRAFDCKQFGEYANGEALRDQKGTIRARRSGTRILVRIEVNDGRTRRTNEEGVPIPR